MADKDKKGATTSVQVAVRIRPPTPQDASIPSRFQRTAVLVSPPSSVLVDPSPSHPSGISSGLTPSSSGGPATTSAKQTFAFDRVLGPTTSQADVYAIAAEPLIARFLEGFNCTVLAYGQTSSGKTYSMTGPDLPMSGAPLPSSGIIPRALHSIFSKLPSASHFTATVAYVEIYNEDLIDLLVEDGENRREVLVREDKEGRIRWEGLREVGVRGVGEVMALLRQGSSVRRTNETDMNAQSSRSHAIFSLTLTQRRPLHPSSTRSSTASTSSTSTLSPTSTRPTSPAPPSSFASRDSLSLSLAPNISGRTSPAPSRLARPASSNTMRSGSPAFNRPPSAMKLRPSGANIGGRVSPMPGAGGEAEKEKEREEEEGPWVTVTSKFHFVDLAGSERLKRTAAQGERIKEGISINGGLLALGNVISALADRPLHPSAGAHTTHIPYRDSKLTRLLQDSLGGNAHTLMLACVAPAEYNLAETLNTLKYAARARGIRNVARVSVEEVGWDDVEWLQGQVSRLRKEITALKAGGATPVSSGGLTTPPATVNRASSPNSQLTHQLQMLQGAHTELSAMYKERQLEVDALRDALAESEAAGGEGGAGGVEKERERRNYAEIVAPVVEEYERRMGAMEVELKLARVALDHTNEMYDAKEVELEELGRKRARSEAAVEELRARVGKLVEREASTERYVHDLEQKVNALEAGSVRQDTLVAELRADLARHREREKDTAAYVSALEARLARADEGVASLKAAVEQLESAARVREEEFGRLERRLEVLTDERGEGAGDSERLMEELEAREQQVRELEGRLEEGEREWERGRKEMEQEREREALASPSTPLAAPPSPSPAHAAAQVQLAALRAEHTTALSDLSSMRAKYESALGEIKSLENQLTLMHTLPGVATGVNGNGDALPTPEPSEGSEGERGSLLLGRRRARGKDGPPFFRSAASSDSLRTRSQSQSQPLFAQELSSPPSWRGGGGSISISTSLSSNGVRSPPSPRLSAGMLSPTSPPYPQPPSPRLSLPPNGSARGWASPPSPRFSLNTLPALGRDERSVQSMEKEIMRLQEVLREREVEITALEQSMKSPSVSQLASVPEDDKDENDEDLQIIVPSVPEESDPSPITKQNLDAIRRDIAQNDAEDASFRLAELMRSMAQKESSHREAVDALNAKLAKISKSHEELTTLSRDQAHNMSTELEALREKLRTTEEKYDTVSTDSREQALTVSTELEGLRSKLRSAEDRQDDLNSTINDLRRRETDLLFARQAAEDEHVQSMAKLRAEHDDALRRKDEEAAGQLARLRNDHAEELKRADMAREGTLTDSQSSHADAIHQLLQEHASALERRETAYNSDVEKTKSEAARFLAAREEEHMGITSRMKSDYASSLSRLQEEKESEVDRLKASLARSREEHEASTVKLREGVETSMSQLKEQHASALADLQQSHERAIIRAQDDKAAEIQLALATEHEAALTELRNEGEAALERARTQHAEELDALRQEQDKAILSLKADHQMALEKSQAAFIAAQQEHQAALDRARQEHEAFVARQRAQHNRSLAELRELQAQEHETLQKAHDQLARQVEEQSTLLVESDAERDRMMDMHEAELQSKSSLLNKLYQELSTLRTERDNHKTRASELEGELKRTQEEQVRVVTEASKRESLVQELERHRAALAEAHDDLQRTKDQKDMLQAEVSKRDSVLDDLKSQLAQAATPKASGFDGLPNGARGKNLTLNLPPSRMNSLTNGLPPPSPPPMGPPPPVPNGQTPYGVDDSGKHSTMNSTLMSTQPTSLMSDGAQSDETASPTNSMIVSLKGTFATDATDGSSSAAQIEELVHQYQEQEVMIKTLNKQLAHCESDLQAHIDLVTTLETSLNDSERSLRKSRVQASELAKERDALSAQAETLRTQLRDAQQDAASMRRSMAEEKQTMERQLEDERKGRERARQQLEQRMEDMHKRKSKFVCM